MKALIFAFSSRVGPDMALIPFIRSTPIRALTRSKSALRHLFISTVLFLVGFASLAFGEEYQLGSGDILEIAVFGRPDLNRKTTIDSDGNISVPLIGQVKAGGSSLPALRSKIRGLLTTSDAVRGGDVIVDLMEYRPFYILGHVAKSGAYPYRPELTVRQAVALAGGLDVSRTASRLESSSPYAAADLRGRYEMLLREYAKQQVRIAGLRAELDKRGDIELSSLRKVPIPPELLAEITALERRHLEFASTERKKDIEHLQRTLKLARDELAWLTEGQKQESLAVAQQAEELQRILELNRRGLASLARVSDEQRAAVLLKTRELDTEARTTRAQQAMEELQRKIDKMEERQAKAPRDLQDAIISLDGLETQLKTVSMQLAITGGSGLLRGDNGTKAPEVAIFRKIAGAETKLIAKEDTRVQPGDVVEITMKLDWLMQPAASED